uniref:C-type lectin domain-containing protein n=1 Tax=Eptatretus burgeri TaxID=7764 RepID=A0A8C4WZ45_EPTBU
MVFDLEAFSSKTLLDPTAHIGVPQPNYEKVLKKIKCNQCIILLFLTLLTILSITIMIGHLFFPGMKLVPEKNSDALLAQMSAAQQGFWQRGQETSTLRNGKPCQSGWLHFNGSCFKTFPSQNLIWYDAEFYCIQHMNGCHLPSVHSEEEYQFLLNLWPNPQDRHIWFGGKYSDLKGKTVWTDETFWDFTKFSDGEPSHHNTTEGCIEYSGDSNGWNDLPCEAKLSVMCKCIS